MKNFANTGQDVLIMMTQIRLTSKQRTKYLLQYKVGEIRGQIIF